VELRRPLSELFVLGVVAGGISALAELAGWFDSALLGVCGALLVLTSAGIEAWLRTREGRPTWDDD
jgi:hypothetical protein